MEIVKQRRAVLPLVVVFHRIGSSSYTAAFYSFI